MKVLEEHNVILAEMPAPNNTVYMFVLNEAIQQVSFVTKTKSAIDGFKDFLLQHPYMTGMAVGIGINAIDSYYANKRQTTRLFAQTQIEKELYKKVAKDLVATGKYTMYKDGKFVKGGWLWELKRNGT
jgi:hypothetical protein